MSSMLRRIGALGVLALTGCVSEPAAPSAGPFTAGRLDRHALFPAAASAGEVVASATGSAHWTIPLPNPFGVEVGNRTLSFNARRGADGVVTGRFEYHQVVEGVAFIFNVSVTCLRVYDGHRAKIGGVVEVSTDPTVAPGDFAWFQVFDSGEGAGAPPDWSSLVGFGDEEANEAFCNSPNLPRFGPWDVEGNIQVQG